MTDVEKEVFLLNLVADNGAYKLALYKYTMHCTDFDTDNNTNATKLFLHVSNSNVYLNMNWINLS